MESACDLGNVQAIFLKGSESQDNNFKIDSHGFDFGTWKPGNGN